MAGNSLYSGLPGYYDDLPERERNLDPKGRSLGVISNFLGLLPYARAGAEAMTRGESFWGGTPQYERQRQALQQYYADAYESAPDSVKVLSVIGLPMGAVSTAAKALAPLGRPAAVAAGLGGVMGATAGYFAPREPDTGDVPARMPNPLLGAGMGAFMGGAGAKASQYANALIGPSPNLAQGSRNALIYDPPPRPVRDISADYPNGAPQDALGRITYDMDGRPIRAAFVAGRTSEAGILPESGVLENLAAISQGLYGAAPQAVAAREIGGDAGRFTSRPNIDGTGRDYFINYDKNLPPPKAASVQAHEIAHGIDELAGRIDTSGLKGELQTVYHDLNNPNPSPTAKQWTPQAAGYKGSDVDREYIAEAVRAYMTDPNYMKTVAPNTAVAIRKAVNSNALISGTLHFNSLAPFLLTAGGSALGLAAYPQADDAE